MGPNDRNQIFKRKKERRKKKEERKKEGKKKRRKERIFLLNAVQHIILITGHLFRLIFIYSNFWTKTSEYLNHLKPVNETVLNLFHHLLYHVFIGSFLPRLFHHLLYRVFIGSVLSITPTAFTASPLTLSIDCAVDICPS